MLLCASKDQKGLASCHSNLNSATHSKHRKSSQPNGWKQLDVSEKIQDSSPVGCAKCVIDVDISQLCLKCSNGSLEPAQVQHTKSNCCVGGPRRLETLWPFQGLPRKCTCITKFTKQSFKFSASAQLQRSAKIQNLTLRYVWVVVALRPQRHSVGPCFFFGLILAFLLDVKSLRCFCKCRKIASKSLNRSVVCMHIYVYIYICS